LTAKAPSRARPADLRRLGVALLRFGAFGALLVAFLLHHFVAGLVIRDEARKLRYYLRSISRTSDLVLWLLNIRVTVYGDLRTVGPQLVVANHLSYLDVLVLFRFFPSLFVTSTEIRDTPVLGHICKLAGCFFVERRRDRRSQTTKHRELGAMLEKFREGFSVFLFPEGTSSDGSTVLPFKGTFFQLAVDTETPVRPLCLKYLGANRDVPPWYGDMTFPDHLFRVCLEDSIAVSVTVLPEIHGTEKMQLAKQCHALITETYA
jgi:1-acyl-sn-glycerol-3-phosphate acyltransferase